MIPNETRFILSRAERPFGMFTEMRFGYRNDLGALHIAKPIEFTVVKDGEPSPSEPMLVVESEGPGKHALQSLLDQLWQLGYRPTDIGTAGHLAATQKHLEDMRALAGHMMQVKLP